MYYQIMFYGGMVVALLMLIVSVIVYRKLDISFVIQDLTGYDMQQISKKVFQRNKQIAEKAITSEIVIKKKFKDEQPHTEMITKTQQMGGSVDETLLMDNENETVLLVEETAPLENETTVLLEEENEKFNMEVNVIVIHSNTII
ncbi:MAG: hypothetical protein ACI35O_09340 [Bacillaceae bacterium]